jgi:hypothetical protein
MGRITEKMVLHARNVTLLYIGQTGSENLPVSSPMVSGSPFPVGKTAEA